MIYDVIMKFSWKILFFNSIINMKILSSKVRGVSRKWFNFKLKEVIRYCNPDIMLLLETKVQLEKARKIIKTFNYLNFIEIPFEGLSRGIWSLWHSSNNFLLHIVSISTRFIHGTI